jgi:long-chain acyl-CoA synthetase
LLFHHAAVRPKARHAREISRHLADLDVVRCCRPRARPGLRPGLARFQAGDNLAIIGDNRPHLYMMMTAAQCLGGVPVPLYQDAVASEMLFVLQDAGIRFVVVEDQEQVDKMLEVKDQVTTLEHIIYDDPRGMRHYSSPSCTTFTN